MYIYIYIYVYIYIYIYILSYHMISNWLIYHIVLLLVVELLIDWSTYGQSPCQYNGFQRVWLKHALVF